MLLHDNGYCETHNALCDAQDELKIMQLLGMPVEKYECAVLRTGAEQQKREKTVFAPAAQSHKDTSTKNCDGIEKKAVEKYNANGNDSFEEVYTADEVAQMLHISRNQVYQLIHGGKLQAYKEKNRFCICKHSVEQYMEEKEREQKIEKRKNFYAWAFSVLVGTIVLLFFFSRM